MFCLNFSHNFLLYVYFMNCISYILNYVSKLNFIVLFIFHPIHIPTYVFAKHKGSCQSVFDFK